ncbi:hypothetical protein T4A_5661 [Trichinella pseudospiralis]|uniref:Uncharacterized protein n=1 Tax=Trichinella pseudospiralis TaxID=6337 RepID=A0A0V1DRD8_TRIPS|nr:hypothetical protein T4A_5661 [Trichinella pseudospiralis]
MISMRKPKYSLETERMSLKSITRSILYIPALCYL